MRLEIGQHRQIFETAAASNMPQRSTEPRLGLPLAIVAGLGIVVWLAVCVLLAPLLQGAALITRTIGRRRRRLNARRA